MKPSDLNIRSAGTLHTNEVLEAQHTHLVGRLKKPGQAILDTLTPEKCDLWHMASCIPGEAGELFDAIKKYVIYGKDLDRDNVVEELGDLEFYMKGLRNILGITREETIAQNYSKLSKRYGEQYSDEAARVRADKMRPIEDDLPDDYEVN